MDPRKPSLPNPSLEELYRKRCHGPIHSPKPSLYDLALIHGYLGGGCSDEAEPPSQNGPTYYHVDGECSGRFGNHYFGRRVHPSLIDDFLGSLRSYMDGVIAPKRGDVVDDGCYVASP